MYIHIWNSWHRVYMVLRMATQPGRTLGLSPTEPRFGRRTCARACVRHIQRQPVRIYIPYAHVYTLYTLYTYTYSIPDDTTTVHG